MTFRFFLGLRSAGLLVVLIVGGIAPAQAQKYRTAAGLRLSSGMYGLTVQQKVLPKTTLEGLLLAGSREVSGTVLAEQHFGLLGRSLNYYLGAGGHVGNNKDTGGFGGVDFIVGAEYKIALTRLVIAADFKPSIEINSADWARFPTALSVRYILIKDKKSGFLNDLFDGSKNKSKPKKRRGLFE